jgi:hypothetical protein
VHDAKALVILVLALALSKIVSALQVLHLLDSDSFTQTP